MKLLVCPKNEGEVRVTGVKHSKGSLEMKLEHEPKTSCKLSELYSQGK